MWEQGIRVSDKSANNPDLSPSLLNVLLQKNEVIFLPSLGLRESLLIWIGFSVQRVEYSGGDVLFVHHGWNRFICAVL